MKRDFDLIRKILLAAEKDTTRIISVEDIMTKKMDDIVYGSETYEDDLRKYGEEHRYVAYQIKLLKEAGFVDVLDKSTKNELDYFIEDITMKGHDYLDSIRDDNVWKEISKKLKTVSGSVPTEIIMKLASSIISRLLGI